MFHINVLQLPPKPSDPSQGTSPSVAPTGGYNPYSPAVAASGAAQQTYAPPAPLNIGFENLSSTFVLRVLSFLCMNSIGWVSGNTSGTQFLKI